MVTSSPLNMLLAFLIALTGNILLYSALAFINAQLLPSLSNAVYAQTTPLGRTLLMTPLFLGVNFMLSLIYRLVDPAVAGLVLLTGLILVLAGKSILLGTGALTLRVAASVALLILCAAWVNYELHRAVGKLS
jgi:hypothetical protein